MNPTKYTGPVVGSGVYRCYTLNLGQEQGFDHLSPEGKTFLCNRSLGPGQTLEATKHTWKNSSKQCEGCRKEARKIRKLQKMAIEHARNNSCRGDAREACPACSQRDDLMEIELPETEKE